MSKLNQNAMADKLDELENRYREFADETDKILLRWLIDPGDEEIVDVFVSYQQEAGNIPDLFMEIKVPFGDDGERYSLQIVQDIQRQYEDIKPGLEEENIATGWILPKREPGENAPGFLVRVLGLFSLYYQNLLGHLTVVLRPRAVADRVAYVRWVETVLQHRPEKTTRLIVLDPIADPVFSELAVSHEELIHSQPLQLDYPGLLEKLAEGTKENKGPDDQFRVLFVRLGNQAKAQDVEGAEKTAREALAVAESMSWHQMQVVVYSVMGACYLQAQDHAAALGQYRAANRIAREAKAAEDPAGAKMEIQTLFAEASVVFAQTKYQKAAKLYMEAAPLAETEEDHLLTMEGWRMAAYCHEVEKQYDKAIYYNQLAMDAGERLPEDQRAQSTLAFVGDSQLRVIEAAKKKRSLLKPKKDLPDAAEVNDKMVALLGPDWQDLVTAATQNLAPQGAAPS